MIKLFKQKYFATLLCVVALVAYGFLVQAAPLVTYNPGETLDPTDPNCHADNDCVVIFPSNWDLTGNAGTDGGITNFIGTTDAQDFVIKTNNTQIAFFGQGGNVALGYGAIASGVNATAFGDTAIASNTRSVAWGYNTQATGKSATAFGNNTLAEGEGATAFGDGTFARSGDETAFGAYNTDYAASGTDLDRLLSIGNGTGFGSPSDAFTILKNGNTAIGINNFEADADATTARLKVAGSFFAGERGFAYVNGEERKMFFDPKGEYFRLGSVAGTEWEGPNLGAKSIAMGFVDSGITGSPVASGRNSISIGDGQASGSRSMTLGYGDGSLTAAYPVASGDNAVAIGVGARAIGNWATSLGHSAEANGFSSTAFGNGTQANGDLSTAFGLDAQANGERSIAMGRNARAESFSEVSTGSFTTHYMPVSTTAWDSADRLFTIGNGTTGGSESDAFTILKNGNTAIGINNFEADADAATAKLKVAGTFFAGQGGFTYGSGEEAKMFFDPTNKYIRMGSVTGTEWDSGNSGLKSTAIGFGVTGVASGPTASGPLSIAIGTGAVASGTNSFAMGFNAHATNTSSIAFGGGTSSGANAFAGSSGTATKNGAFAFGSSSLASGVSSVAFSGGTASGTSAVAFAGAAASGAQSFAIGSSASAGGANAAAFGMASASASQSFAIGSATASGFRSFAGAAGTASIDEAFAFGSSSLASGVSSVAFSGGTASNTQSIAMGPSATASGSSAVAIGQLSNATGFQSGVFGNNSTASGDRGYIIGTNSTAKSFEEIVVGSYNTAYTPVSTTAWAPADRLFTVGKGFGLGSESDAFTIMKNGKVGVGYSNFEAVSTGSGAILQVNGAITQTNAGSCSLSADSAGIIICTPSDRNLKTNINDLTYGLDTVMHLRPVSYDFRDPKYGTGTQIGFIAQELEQTVPEVVTQGPQYKSVNYGLLTSVLVKSVQELNLKLNNIDTQANAFIANETFLGGLRNWLADATNGITKIFAQQVETKSLCVADDAGDKTCITKAQLDQILAGQGNVGGNSAGNSSVPTPVPDPAPAPDPIPLSDPMPVPDPAPQIVPTPDPVPDPASADVPVVQ